MAETPVTKLVVGDWIRYRRKTAEVKEIFREGGRVCVRLFTDDGKLLDLEYPATASVWRIIR